MTESSFSVYRLLRQHILAAAKPAYLVTDQQFRLVSSSGELDFYGLLNLKVGVSCEDRLGFLIGYNVTEPLELRFYQFSEEIIAHVVLLPHEEHLIILFMDASDAYHQEVKIQQKTNDLLILSEKQYGLVKELVKARDSIAKKHEQLNEANQAKAKFIADMSEEIKSPLTSILGHASLLKGAAGQSDEALKMVSAIERGGRHLLTMVENLLDQMHIELDELRLKYAPVDINELAQDLNDIFSPVAKRKNLEFSIELESLPPNKIRLDEIRLRQALVNLLDNAFKFTDMGMVKLTFDWKEKLLIDIYDTGRGIPVSFQEEMFSAFKQPGQEQLTHAHQNKGKGLGLSIAKQLIELMNGEIACESIVGVETQFRLSIPVELVAESQYDSTFIDDIEFGDDAHVLAIEPSEDICQLYDMALSKAGFLVSSCHTVDEGIKTMMNKKPGLILISLANQTESLDAVKQIRDAGFHNPVLVLLSMDSSASSRSVFEAGGNGYITKPINIIDLIETVKAYVSPDQTDGSDVTMRTYLRERFNEYLEQKAKQLAEIITRISSNKFNPESDKVLQKEVQQILLTSEMYSYTAIVNAANVVINVFQNQKNYKESEFISKLLEALKVLHSEITFIQEK